MVNVETSMVMLRSVDLGEKKCMRDGAMKELEWLIGIAISAGAKVVRGRGSL